MGQFTKGQSGNPSGRPKQDNSRLAEKLKEHGASILQVVVDQALKGDLVACKLVLDRLYPPLASAQCVTFNAPPNASLSETGQGIIKAVAGGEIAPDVGGQLLQRAHLPS